MRGFVGWLGWVAVTMGAGIAGTLLSRVQASQFYQQLQRPSWAPPSWVFGPVWTLLYLMMGTAAWMVWRKAGFAEARFAPVLFLVHLLFNAAWTGIFFGLELPGVAFAEILVLWLMIALLLVRFWSVEPASGMLMLPYLVWVSYAAALNFALWRMNPRM
jgi:benzodiazapine receptor